MAPTSGLQPRSLSRRETPVRTTTIHTSSSCHLTHECECTYPEGSRRARLTSHLRPHWWYGVMLAICVALSLGTIYGAGLQLSWWGFLLMALIAWIFTFPNGILWGVANQQIGMSYLSEVIAGSLFPGQPISVLTSMTYARQILEQNLNLISDYKFGFYMKIPEKEMFIGQVW